jgi:hypothetical protein
MLRLFFFILVSFSISACSFGHIRPVSDDELIEVVRYHNPMVENVFKKLIEGSKEELVDLNLTLVIVDVLFAPIESVPIAMFLQVSKYADGLIVVTKGVLDQSYYFLPFAIAHEIGHAYMESIGSKRSVRRKELDADILGLTISVRGGYDPKEIVKSACKWMLGHDKLLVKHGVDPYNKRLHHPAGADRCRRLRAWLKKNH